MERILRHLVKVFVGLARRLPEVLTLRRLEDHVNLRGLKIGRQIERLEEVRTTARHWKASLGNGLMWHQAAFPSLMDEVLPRCDWGLSPFLADLEESVPGQGGLVGSSPDGTIYDALAITKDLLWHGPVREPDRGYGAS